MTTWKPSDTAPNNKTVAILYRDVHGSHKAVAKRPTGATSWHNPVTAVEITTNRFIDGWLPVNTAKDWGLIT